MAAAGGGAQVLCCMCGMLIPANAASMCINCIKSKIDITEGIPKQLPISWCKGCQRFLHTNVWVAPAPESRELLAMLVKKVRGLNRVRLTDASFIWTEPHSKRLKIKLTIQKEVLNGVILQQAFVVEFVLQNLYCPDCHKAQSPHTWVAEVQLRQRVGHKRTVYLLEQLILRHNAHANVTSLKESPDGLDFYFGNASHARRFVDFVSSVCPIRSRNSKKLISHDLQSNVFGYKYTWFVEIVPVCRDDLVCLPRRIAGSLGVGQLVLVERVTGALRLLDYTTLARTDINATAYWQNPFRPMFSAAQLVEYTVLDVAVVGAAPWMQGQQQQAVRGGMLADVVVARTADLGNNDTSFTVRTHLGSVLKPGDTALGYDIATANANDEAADALAEASGLPDVVLVRKGYHKRHKKRIWALKQLERQDGSGGDAAMEDAAAQQPAAKKPRGQKGDEMAARAADMEHLMRDIEEDPELRSNVNLYKVPDAQQILAVREARKAEERATGADDMVDEGEEEEEEEGDDEPEGPAFPDVRLDELIDAVGGLTIKPGGAGAAPAEGDEDDGDEGEFDEVEGPPAQ
eukprot:m51a1_g14701 putative 60s ribosomal export protein (574) ;mRNA; f:125153-127047